MHLALATETASTTTAPEIIAGCIASAVAISIAATSAHATLLARLPTT